MDGTFRRSIRFPIMTEQLTLRVQPGHKVQAREPELHGYAIALNAVFAPAPLPDRMRLLLLELEVKEQSKRAPR